jgi:hypothetical protein
MNLTGLGSSRMLYVSIIVNQTYGVDLTGQNGENDFLSSMTPGVERTFVYRLKNTGNGLDRYSVRIGSAYDRSNDAVDVMYDGWTARITAVSNTPDYTSNIVAVNFFEPIVVRNTVSDVYYVPDLTTMKTTAASIEEIREIALILDMGQMAWVHVVLIPPTFQSEGNEGIPVVVAASGIGTDDRAASTNTVQILLPDIAFVGGIAITSPSGGERIVDGDAVTIMVRLENVGDISVENVDVQLLVDGSVKKVSTLRAMRNQTADVKTVVFTWIAESGTHDIEMIIDPENTIVESHDQFTNYGEGDNNRIGTKVDVEGVFIVKEFINRYPIVSSLLILLLSIIVLAGIATRMSRRNE